MTADPGASPAGDPTPSWSAVRALFEEVVDLPPDARAARLDERCGDDAALRTAVDELIAADESADRLSEVVEAAVAEEADSAGREAARHAAAAAVPLDVLTGRRIGRYRVLRLLGAGGMGAVYEAEQDEPRRTVALKTARFGLTSETALQRFRFEAEVLGRLQHPGIARVYEAGTYEEGAGAAARSVPWYAMEYVEDARTVQAFADEERLDTAARLELFVQVCDAVHAGRLKGVVHRDLKPGNILVDREGRPRIIDFGVARVLDAGEGDRHTRTGDVVGTLGAMSPEQVSGDPDAVDARTDVYALGVVLFELLTGSPPLDLDGKGLTEVARLIATHPPRRVSSVSPGLPRELDWILERALAKDKTDRYASVDALAGDLRRLLAHEPVSAGPPSAAYRLRVFVRRHRFGVAVTAAFFVMAVVGVSTIWQSLEQERLTSRELEASLLEEQRLSGLLQESLATTEESLASERVQRERSDAISHFFEDMYTYVSPARGGREVRVVELLDASAPRLATDFADQPLVRADLEYAVGQAYRFLGRFVEAEPHLRQALELRQAHLPETHRDRLQVEGVLGDYLCMNGQLEEGEALLRHVHAVREAALGPGHGETLWTAASLVKSMAGRGAFQEAEALVTAAWETRKDAQDLGEVDILLLDVYVVLLLRSDRYEEALDVLDRVEGARLELIGPDDPDLVGVHMNRAVCLMQLRRYEDAAPVARLAAEGTTRVFGPDHPHTLGALHNLGAILTFTGDAVASEELHRDILARIEGSLPPGHPDILHAMEGLGHALFEQDRNDEAVAVYLETVALAEAGLPGDHPTLSRVRAACGRVLVDSGRPAEGIPLLRRAHPATLARNGPEHERTVALVEKLVEACEALALDEEAEEWRARLPRGDSE